MEKLQNQEQDLKPQLKKFLIEIGPIIVFFAANKYFSDEDGLGGAVPATAVFMIAFAISMICSKIYLKKISKMLWFSGVLVGFFGALTIYFNDPKFIQIKPTIVYSLFATILLGGYAIGRPFLKNIMAIGMPPIKDSAWMTISRNFGLFFIGCAALNEFLWRNNSFGDWIAMKGYIFVPLPMVFMMTQIPILLKNQIEEEAED